MIYKLETYNGKIYEITKEQFDFLNKNIDSMSAVKLGEATEMKGNIRDFYADYEATRERKEQEENDISVFLGGGIVAGLLGSGEVKKDIKYSKNVRMKLKKIWFEHVKRRPVIDKLAKRVMKYSMEEYRIFNTPIEILMSDFEKTLC